jgi:hypothetical protein
LAARTLPLCRRSWKWIFGTLASLSALAKRDG